MRRHNICNTYSHTHTDSLTHTGSLAQREAASKISHIKRVLSGSENCVAPQQGKGKGKGQGRESRRDIEKEAEVACLQVSHISEIGWTKSPSKATRIRIGVEAEVRVSAGNGIV